MGVGTTYLDYIGVPDEYPDYARLSDALDDALLEAAEAVVDEWRQRDPVLVALLDGRWDLYRWEDDQPVADLPPGVPIIVRVYAGGFSPGYVDCEAVTTGEVDSWGKPRVRYRCPHGTHHNYQGDVCRARLPVPLDLAAVVCDAVG